MIILVKITASFILFFYQGDPMPSLKIAKRAVAVRACKMLYENEELNEDLKPFNKIKCLNNIHSLYFSHWNSPDFVKGMIVIYLDHFL